MTNTPLTIRIPIKGTLLLRLEGSEELHELGKITYESEAEIQLSSITGGPVTWQQPAMEVCLQRHDNPDPGHMCGLPRGHR